MQITIIPIITQQQHKQPSIHTYIHTMQAYSQLKYQLTRFRTSPRYIVYQVLQLLLSIVIILLAILTQDSFRSLQFIILEFLLLLLMIVDLFVIRGISEGKVCGTCNNRVDFVIVAVFMGTLLFLCVSRDDHDPQHQYSTLMEADDIILITIIAVRYTVQLIQVIKNIRNTKKNIDYQKKMKDVDLNVQPQLSMVEDKNGNLVPGYNNFQNQGMHEEILRQKLEKRLEYREKQRQQQREKDRDDIKQDQNLSHQNKQKSIQIQLPTKN